MTQIRNTDGESVAALADGWSLRSGVYDQAAPDALTSGEYVRLCRPDGTEYAYWDAEEWTTDPALVMGAIINAAAGLRPLDDQPGTAAAGATAGEDDSFPDRPRIPCGCGYDLVYISGDWEHDAAPSLWGDDHDPDGDFDEADPAVIRYWDIQDCVIDADDDEESA